MVKCGYRVPIEVGILFQLWLTPIFLLSVNILVVI